MHLNPFRGFAADDRQQSDAAYGCLMRWGLALFVLLSGCDMAVEDLTRDAAKRAVEPVVADRFPGLNIDPAVECIVANAGPDELLALAGDALTGPTASTIEITGNIAVRPSTGACFASNGLPALMGNL